MERDDVKRYYENRKRQFQDLFHNEKRILLYLSILRSAIFISGLVVTILLFREGILAGFLSLGSFASLFGILLKTYAGRSWNMEFYSKLIILNENELSGLAGDFSFFDAGDRYSDPSHNFSHDIDLFGPSSFYQYINRTCTDQGSDLLAGWLGDPFGIRTGFDKRREAIRELIALPEWRQKFIALGMVNRPGKEDTEKFKAWLSEPPVFSDSKFFRVMIYLLPAITILLLLLLILNMVHYTLFVFPFLIDLLVVTVKLKDINRIHRLVSKQYNFLSTFQSLIAHLENNPFNSEFLSELQGGLSGEGISAVKRVKKLSRIIQAFDNRLNMIVGVIIDGLFLWDYHCIIKLEKWKEQASHLLPVWFENIGIVDGLISLSGYGFNNPDYCFPDLSDGSVYLDARNLGHPLLPWEIRVLNDFNAPCNGIINIITGANMSGKSTFLRTVVINLVMAMIAAPVCATRFLFTPAKLFSSMRTSDSLSEHESYFFAELKRLKLLKEELERGTKIFFVLDEILKGTNSKDKSEGSWLFIEKVIMYGGTGLVATHDILLGKLAEKYPSNVMNKCFEIDIEEEDVNFDYILREGITTRMNAALLMKQQGIID
ncbi:MAG TPA: hypothetical protein VMW76_01805 [Bacteroidales bacterium]|nr:hypothetical protein [Bacteroidales bacterium]